MEIELKRLEDLSESIVQDFSDMKKREEEMRDTNGKFIRHRRPMYVVRIANLMFFLFLQSPLPTECST